MNEQFGTQGGFGDLMGASAKFEGGTEIFKTAVGKFAFGALSLEKVFESDEFKNWTGTAFKLSGVLRGMTEVFAKSKLIDVFSDLSIQLYDSRKEFERSFSMFGDGRSALVDSLREQTNETQKFGIRMEQNVQAFKSLAGLFGTTNFEAELASTASIIGKAFDMSSEGSAELVFALNQFGGMTGKQSLGYMNELNEQFHLAGLSNQDLGKAMEGASQNMWRLQLNTDKGQKKFKEMAVASTKLGISIDKMIDSADKFRTLPGAIEGSVTASLAGLNMSANQMLSMARGGDPSQMFSQVFDHLGKFTDQQGNLSQVGIDIADQLGPLVDMNRKEMQMALTRMNQTGNDSLKHFKTMNDRLYRQQTVQEKMENALYDLGSLILPIMDPLFGILEWATQNANYSKAIMISVGLIWMSMKANKIGGAIKTGAKATGGFLKDPFGMGKMFNVPSDWAGPTTPKAGGGEIGKAATTASNGSGAGAALTKSQQATQRGIDTKQMKLNNTKMLNQSKLVSAQAKQMAASAVMMIAFAGALWILSKAFQGFGEVSWGGVGKGITVMVAFGGTMVGMMALMGTLATTAAPVMWAGVALMLAFSAAMIGMAYALKLADKPIQTIGFALKNIISQVGESISIVLGSLGEFIIKVADPTIGLGLGATALGLGLLATGLSAIIGVGAGAGIASLFGGGVEDTINRIGESAAKHASNIETLSYALDHLATTIGKLREMEAIEMDLKIDTKSISMLDRVTKDFAKNSAASNREIIENHITIELDGAKLARKIVKTDGVRG